MINKENFLKLANYLDTLQDDYDKFGMATYMSYSVADDPSDLDGVLDILTGNKEDYPCGTVACALGHAPLALKLSNKKLYEFFKTIRNEDNAYAGVLWDKMFYELFIEDCSDSEYVDNVFRWCFAAEWEDIDNTPHGAAKRIRYMLERGVPSNLWAQLHAEELYLFADAEN